MDKVKECVDYVNFHWIIIVITGIYIHLRDICLIGLCFEITKDPPFNPSYASLIFMFSAICLLAEYKLWPRSLKEPPLLLLVVYEILFTALVTDLVKRIIWIPLMHLTWCMTQESGTVLMWLNSQLELGKYSQLMMVALYMKTEVAAMHAALLISALSLLWMLDATETIDSVMLDLWAKRLEKIFYQGDKRITFVNPEVTDYFVYCLLKK